MMTVTIFSTKWRRTKILKIFNVQYSRISIFSTKWRRTKYAMFNIQKYQFLAQNEDWGAEKIVFTPTADGNGANIETLTFMMQNRYFPNWREKKIGKKCKMMKVFPAHWNLSEDDSSGVL